MESLCYTVCLIGIGCVVIWIIAAIVEGAQKSKAERERKEAARQSRVDSSLRSIEDAKEAFNNYIRNSFGGGYYWGSHKDTIDRLQSAIDQCIAANSQLEKDSPSQVESELIDSLEKKRISFRSLQTE